MYNSFSRFYGIIINDKNKHFNPYIFAAIAAAMAPAC